MNRLPQYTMKLFKNVFQVCKYVLQAPENDFFKFHSSAMQLKKLVLRTSHYKFSPLNCILKQLLSETNNFRKKIRLSYIQTVAKW